MVNLSDFKIYNYPDGHKHAVSDKDLKGESSLVASIRNFDDLFLIAQIKRIHPEIKWLYVKYLLAGRCDRRFSPGEAIDLEIVCDFINSMGFVGVSVLKPHSDKTRKCLKNYHDWDVTSQLISMCKDDLQSKNICFVSPDIGASRWIHKYNLGRVMQCSKKRNAQGAVEGVEFLADDSFEQNKDFVIVDDLCDGGGTFIAIAKAIKERLPLAKVYLVVTHAIFSKGFEPFQGYIERVYCTDSFATFDNPLVRQLKVS